MLMLPATRAGVRLPQESNPAIRNGEEVSISIVSAEKSWFDCSWCPRKSSVIKDQIHSLESQVKNIYDLLQYVLFISAR